MGVSVRVMSVHLPADPSWVDKLMIVEYFEGCRANYLASLLPSPKSL
jgi:hypothetical protein